MYETVVYVATIPETEMLDELYPRQRQSDVDACSNLRVRREKYFVWKLLEIALKENFGVDIKDLTFQKNENKKWSCDKYFFSLSHTDGALAVAVSRENVGVDIEVVRPRHSGIEEHFMTRTELALLDTLTSDDERCEYIIRKWTEKESVFKTLDRPSFSPTAIETAEYDLHTCVLELSGRKYMLSVTPADAKVVHYNW